jgi:fructose-specific phosphotransferase system IIC component
MKRFYERLGDPFIGWLFATLLFTLILHFFPTTGSTIIIIIIAFFLSDFIATWVIKRKEGRVAIAVVGSHKKGHVFLAYYIGIILATIVAGMAADYFINSVVISSVGDWFSEFVVAALLSFFIWIELQTKFYVSKKHG